MTLYHYFPKNKTKGEPLLIIPALINKNYIMDLLSGFSMIESLVNNGIDVYIIDWGEPSYEHGGLELDDYIDGMIKRCCKRVMRYSNFDSLHILGQCIGGILATIFAAKYSDQKFIRSLTCLTTPVDLKNAGMLYEWTNGKTFNLNKIVNTFKIKGAVDAEFIHSSFMYLDVNLTFNKYKNLFQFSDNEAFVKLYRALDFWGNDNINFPVEVFRKFIGELYQKNAFFKDELIIGDKKIGLSDINVPVYNVIAKQDHVFPVCSAQGWKNTNINEYEEDVFEGGHVTIIAALPVRFKIYSKIAEFIKKHH